MKNRGYEFAFKGAMNAYGILARNAVFWLGHVTGTGGESVAHYWPNDCETCKEIAKFVSGWSPERQPTTGAGDRASVCQICGNPIISYCSGCGAHEEPPCA